MYRTKIMQNIYTTSVFKLLYKREDLPADGGLKIEVSAPMMKPDDELLLTGSCEALGCWNLDVARRMSYVGSALWSVSVDIAEVFEYKFVIKRHGETIWEGGENRVIGEEQLNSGYVQGLEFRSDERVRFAGVAIPLFSLRTEQSQGIGDFVDLRKMADWASEVGLRVIQILPINDTTQRRDRHDAFPYNAITSFGLHPLYLSVNELGAAYKEDGPFTDIDYDQVSDFKWSFFEECFARRGEQDMDSDSYREFFSDNEHWLKPYALFCALRDRYGTTDTSLWQQSYSDELFDSCTDVGIHLWLQYHLDRQLRDSVAYCHSKGVLLKGDIPIGVSPCSVETWSMPHLFNMDVAAGAPPDDFSHSGQNWGFPTYNWERMAEDGYLWWRQRLEKMADYFDMYRIDHILGFFRIWEIPKGAPSALVGYFSPSLPYSLSELKRFGLPLKRGYITDDEETLFVEYGGGYCPRINGYKTALYGNLSAAEKQSFDKLYEEFYFRRHNSFWEQKAMDKLPALLAATSMLCCGEDLGMIPSCVEDVMGRLKILTQEIQRMPKRAGEVFGQTNQYPYLSVATTSTHDMSTIRGWWREDTELTERYYHQILWQSGAAPEDASGDICKIIVGNHLNALSIFTILPMQDWLSIDESLRSKDVDGERINVPGLADHFWVYRLHITIDYLLGCDDFNANIRRLIRDSGR